MRDNLSITTKRLRELIDKQEKRGISRTQIKEDIGCDLSTITKHYNGDREVNSSFIVKYAKYFHVSADYLLGLSDAPTSNTDLQGVCDFTGLSPKAVQIIRDYIKSEGNKLITDYRYNLEHEWIGEYIHDQRKILNSFIEDGYLVELITVFADYSFSMETNVIHLSDTLPMLEKVKIELQSDVESMVDPVEYIELNEIFSLIQLHYYEAQEIPKDYIRNKYSELIARHNHDKTKYQSLRKDIDELLYKTREGDPNADNQETE